MNSENELAVKYMKILCERFGTLDAERFIHDITSNRFDYTEWQHEYYDAIPENELQEAIDSHSKLHPFKENSHSLKLNKWMLPNKAHPTAYQQCLSHSDQPTVAFVIHLKIESTNPSVNQAHVHPFLTIRIPS